MNKHASLEQLTLYHYGELPDEQLRELEQHLHDCSQCRSEFAELRSGLQQIPVPELQLDPLQQQRFTARVLHKTRRPSRPLAAWGGSLAAAGALALAVIVLQPASQVSTPPARPELADYEILEQLDLLQELELLQQLELLEELEQLG